MGNLLLSQCLIPQIPILDGKKTPKETGLLVEVETGKILLDQLPMPHSPVYFDDKIYFLLSGTGEIKCYDLKTEKVTLISKVDSFLRGMVVHDDFFNSRYF